MNKDSHYFSYKNCIYYFLTSASVRFPLRPYLPLNKNHKISNPQNTNVKKVLTHKIPTRKVFEPIKYTWEKVLDSQYSTWKKFGLVKIPTWKNVWPTNTSKKNLGPQENVLDPRNTHEIKFWTNEIPTKRNFRPKKARWYDRPTKYPRQKFMNP